MTSQTNPPVPRRAKTWPWDVLRPIDRSEPRRAA